MIWPNGLHRKPDGIRTKRNVSVVTIAEKPFIFIRPGSQCDPATEVLCPRKLNGIYKRQKRISLIFLFRFRFN